MDCCSLLGLAAWLGRGFLAALGALPAHVSWLEARPAQAGGLVSFAVLLLWLGLVCATDQVSYHICEAFLQAGLISGLGVAGLCLALGFWSELTAM